MSTLTTEKCTACRPDSPRASELEIQELKAHVPDWTIVERESIQRLQRVFRFRDFAEALAFTNRVGALAEAEGHHPAILTEWGHVTVTLWTHKIRALHRADFVMAAKIDTLGPTQS
jgi:4a-hydroxytetrahydrobiopterin dehydratase